jgi:8-amino-7-oxononanoate synthase
VSDPLGWLDTRAAERVAAGLRRELRPRPAGEDVLDLAGNDYLGLSRHPEVTEAAATAVKEWGAGSTGSRLVTGSTALHADLEAELAASTGAPAALVFSSGYLANLAALGSLAGAGDLVVSDAHNHASVVDGCRLSRARIAVVPHRDATAVRDALARRDEERALVVTDSVFSVDGDLAPLAALHRACRAHGAVLVVDDAHALGVLGPGGRGAVAAAGLAGEPDVVWTSTLSKSLGSQGGVLLGPRRVVEHVVDSARSFVFDTALAPSSAGAALAALRLLSAAPDLATAARAAASALADLARTAGFASLRPEAAVVGVPVGSPDAAVDAAAACLAAGVRVGCFRPPSVPDGVSRLRLTARATLTEHDLARAQVALSAAKTRVRDQSRER